MEVGVSGAAVLLFSWKGKTALQPWGNYYQTIVENTPTPLFGDWIEEVLKQF